MRVVAGEARGRRLVAPEGRETRPTGDRVRESIFNALVSLDAIRGARVLDLFAGSGALGVEALSRGARECVFVDDRPAALQAIRQNLVTTGLAARGVVVADDALRYVAGGAARFELVLADPPYAFDRWRDLLEKLDAAVVVAESNREIEPELAVEGRWHASRVKRYGGTVVSFLTQADRQD